MAAPGWEGASQPAPSTGRDGGRESPALGWDSEGNEGVSAVCALGSVCAAPSGTFRLCVHEFLCRCGWERGLGTPRAAMGVFLRRGAAHAVKGSWEWHLAGTQVPKPRFARLRGWLRCPVPGWQGAVLWGLPRRSGCAPGLRAGPCSALSVQCVAECQLSFSAEMPLASHQRWRSGTVLEELQ